MRLHFESNIKFNKQHKRENTNASLRFADDSIKTCYGLVCLRSLRIEQKLHSFIRFSCRAKFSTWAPSRACNFANSKSCAKTGINDKFLFRRRHLHTTNNSSSRVSVAWSHRTAVKTQDSLSWTLLQIAASVVPASKPQNIRRIFSLNSACFLGWYRNLNLNHRSLSRELSTRFEFNF